jgi:hypothetical protein
MRFVELGMVRRLGIGTTSVPEMWNQEVERRYGVTG